MLLVFTIAAAVRFSRFLSGPVSTHVVSGAADHLALIIGGDPDVELDGVLRPFVKHAQFVRLNLLCQVVLVSLGGALVAAQSGYPRSETSHTDTGTEPRRTEAPEETR